MEQRQIQQSIEVGSAEEGPVEITQSGRQGPKKSPDWIVPPGLIHVLYLFEAHCVAAKGEPILIVGPTGVGKRFFKEIFKMLYWEENNRGPIVEINCSHFKGDLARSELFGYVRGAFTGAYRNTLGYVVGANRGVLILEEIEELPQEVQAMLLTFIDTGEFRRVGETKIQEGISSVQVVGLTIYRVLNNTA